MAYSVAAVALDMHCMPDKLGSNSILASLPFPITKYLTLNTGMKE